MAAFTVEGEEEVVLVIIMMLQLTDSNNK